MPEVRRTVEFERVAALPRRRFTLADAEAWAARLTPELRRPGVHGAAASLRPWQALGLAEAAANDGAYLAFPVGVGKTLVAELLPVVMEAKRAVLIVPASLKDKSHADRTELQKAWKLASPPPRITTMRELAPDSGAYLLDQLRPDLIIIDECDELANSGSSAAHRIDRYVVKRQDAVRVVAMTGTPSRNSIKGYWHLLCWALRERAPVPLNEGEADMWAAALDAKQGRNTGRVKPGPLGATRDEALAWYSARIQETPGVVCIDGDSAEGVPLKIRVRLARECADLDRHYQRFQVEQENPRGIAVSDPLSRWMLDGFLGTGLCPYYDPAPPDEWRDNRRAVCAFVRNAIEASQTRSRPLDTEAQVLRRYEGHPVVQSWLAVRDSFTPRTSFEWLSTSALESVVDWLEEENSPGIVWCGSVEFATALADAVGLPYYGRQGRDRRGRPLHAADTSRSMVASWHANKRGFNLQPWRRMLIVHPPQSAKYLEQIFGRSHRAGQTEPVVVDVLATSGGTLDAFEAAVREARFAQSTVGLTQKILRADIERARPRKTASNKYRWANRSGL